MAGITARTAAGEFAPRSPQLPGRRTLLLLLGVLCIAAQLRADDLPPPAESDAAAARRLIQQALEKNQPPAPAETVAAAPAAGDPAAESLQIAKLSAEVAAKSLEAKRLAQKSPAEALALLDSTAAGLDGQAIAAEKKDQLLRRIERARRDIEETTGKRRAELALEARNEQIENEIGRERAAKVEIDQRIALLVEEYNSLVDQHRYPEAEAVAKKAGELAPDNLVVRQLLAQSRVIRRIDTQRTIDGGQQSGFLDVVEDVERSAAPFAGPIEFPATRDWKDLTKNRAQLQAEGRSKATPAELEIHRRLEMKVKPDYRDKPLAVVLDGLAKQAGVGIHLDMVGFEQEAVRSDTPVTLALDQPISLKSALKLLL